MPTLPTTTAAFASSATEAEFKTFLTGQREFLAGLLGTDGTAATAKATLGVNDGVTSVNGNTRAITAAQIAAAATEGYGYTPANSTHTHSYVSTDMTHGAVGSLCFARLFPTSIGIISLAAGATVAGSALTPAGGRASGTTHTFESSGSALSGTWRCLGYAWASRPTSGTVVSAFSLFQRIS